MQMLRYGRSCFRETNRKIMHVSTKGMVPEVKDLMRDTWCVSKRSGDPDEAQRMSGIRDAWCV